MIIPTPIDEIVFHTILPLTRSVNSRSKISVSQAQTRLPLETSSALDTSLANKSEIHWNKILIVVVVILAIGTAIYIIKHRKNAKENDSFHN